MNFFKTVLPIGIMLTLVIVRTSAEPSMQPEQWSVEKANQWYASQSWIVGCNFLPSTAVNDVEMWQSESFDLQTIDEELALARQWGFNSVRVFLNYIVWEAEPDALKKNFTAFLEIAEKHGLSVMPILLDDCNFSNNVAAFGKQPDPVPGIHNSGWVSSPPLAMMNDEAAQPKLKAYIQDMVKTFGTDKRIVVWDLYNEPAMEHLALVKSTFAWAREMQPSQPITTGLWVDYSSELCQWLLDNSDIVTFHGYDCNDATLQAKIKRCAESERPIICTEWLFRQGGSTPRNMLPLFKKLKIGAYNWGLIEGRTQTYMPWGSVKDAPKPALWQHDLIRADGTPYKLEEYHFFRHILLGEDDLLGAQPLKENRVGDWTLYTLSGDLISLEVVPSVGGRILQYKLGNHGFFYVNPDEAGKMPKPTTLGKVGTWGNHGGAKLWPAPQGWANSKEWPGPPDPILDGGIYAVLEKSNVSMTLQSPPDKEFSGIQFTNEFSFDPTGTQVRFKSSMKNVFDQPIRWGIWSHLQLDASIPGSADYNRLHFFCPINPQSKFEKGYDVIFGKKDNPSFSVDAARKMFEATYLYQVGKVGIDSPGGWAATYDPLSGNVFVQLFRFEKDKEYPENSSVEIWLNGVGRFHAYHQDIECSDDPQSNPYVFESEIISPYAELKPQEEYHWTYSWNAAHIGRETPVILGCTDAGIVAAAPRLIAVTKSSDSLKLSLSGRFGVFFPGILTAESLDVQGKPLGKPIPLAEVTPLAEVRIVEKVISVPAPTQSLRISVIRPQTFELVPLTEITLRL